MNKITLTQLGNESLWKPVYGRFNKAVTMQRLDALAEAGVDKALVDQTRDFVSLSYSQISGRTPIKSYGFVFAIPTRINRTDSSNLSEARHFLPIVDQLTPAVAQIFMTELPVSILDEYHDENQNAVGAVVFVPLFSDMLTDIRSKIRLKLVVRKIIKQLGKFSKQRLDADIVGLGATLPKITRFGRDVSKHGVVTTTGHAGTVYLIYMQYRELARRYDRERTGVIGIVGAGSIGASAAALLLAQYPDATILMYDTRPEVLSRVVSKLAARYEYRVSSAESNSHVLKRSTIIISAVTSRIKLENDIDLTGKIIIDDSQPGSFDSQDVESRGGLLVWVVGHDNTNHKILTRNSTFRYGDDGLVGVGNVWGCEAEVATLWQTGRPDLALDDNVSPESALAVGRIMEMQGITIAPWQAYGKIVKPLDLTQ